MHSVFSPHLLQIHRFTILLINTVHPYSLATLWSLFNALESPVYEYRHYNIN